MGIAELKNEIIEIINTSDERFLRMINALHQTYKADIAKDDGVVAYTFQGESLTKAKIIENNKEAIKSIEEGHYKSHSEIREKYTMK